MVGAVNFVLVALLGFMAASSSLAQTTCSSYSGEAACVADPLCQWFLNACINKPQVNCKNIKDKQKCKNTPGCKYYPQLQWWLPDKFIQHNNGDFSAPVIGCDTNTMCDRLTVSDWCNSYSHCTWVDGACKTFGTPADPDWVADCTGSFQPRRKKNCDDLGPQCKYVNMRVCNNKGKKCDNVLYGCRKAAWCEVSKGPFRRNQCTLLGDRCQWENGECKAAPTSSPTFRPSDAPTKTPSKSPTRKPTTAGPTKSPTKQPTKAPTAPTTLSPTKQPTAPTTLAPTLRPTTAAPTRMNCPVTRGSGNLQCRSHPFAQLDMTFTPPPLYADKAHYCTEICAQGGAAGSFGEPVFPGCRAWTYDGSVCRLFGCYVGGTGAYEATVVAAAGITHGTLSAQCYTGGFPTPAPTQTCLYTNTQNPPRQVADDRPIAPVCRLGNATMSRDFVGTPRVRLDWCQQTCTNVYGGCTVTELYGVPPNGSPARCIYANCETLAPAISRDIYRSTKTNVC